MFKKIFLSLLTLSILSCQKEKKQGPFEITKNRIGHLTNETRLQELDSIYANDSIVKKSDQSNEFFNASKLGAGKVGVSKLSCSF